jgi:rhodanese-related sulfurtransferase
MRITKIFTGLALAVIMLFTTTACSTTESIDPSTATAIIDVRTVEEFNAGHLDGAVNIPVEVGDFVGSVSTLDPGGKYLIYCKSGRRAGLAIEKMTQLGFTDVSNLGSLENAASVTQLAVVR